jgi:hypothetical protein
MKNCKKQNLITKILGYRVNLNKIKNPTLRRILNENHLHGFLFGYDDNHTDTGRKYSEAHSERYSDKTYYDYNEHKDNHRDYRGEGGSHPCSRGEGYSYSDENYLDHVDKGYSEHTHQNYRR